MKLTMSKQTALSIPNLKINWPTGTGWNRDESSNLYFNPIRWGLGSISKARIKQGDLTMLAIFISMNQHLKCSAIEYNSDSRYYRTSFDVNGITMIAEADEDGVISVREE